MVTTLAAQTVTGQDGDVDHVFVSGNLALDLIGSRKWRRSDPEELLDTPESLGRWIAQSGLLAAVPPCTPTDLRYALALRESVYALVDAALHGVEPTTRDLDLALVNTVARRRAVVLQLTGDGVQHDGGVPEALASVARAAVDALAPESRPHLKECARPECTRVYLDRSRGRRRTWCGMAECGDRVKAAAYRERRRRGLAPSSAPSGG